MKDSFPSGLNFFFEVIMPKGVNINWRCQYKPKSNMASLSGRPSSINNGINWTAEKNK